MLTKENRATGPKYRQQLERIFRAAVAQVEPADMVGKALSLEKSILSIRTETQHLDFDLTRYLRVVALGIGKAGASMARGLEQVLGNRLAGGLIAVKKGHSLPLQRLELIEAAHPVPDQSSVDAGRRLLQLAKNADENSLVLILISGGGSAIACVPLCTEEIELTLADKAMLTKLLLECGAEITEINTVRRHFSAFKGGRLAEALYPAHSLTLILSDVIGDDLNAIASGPTVPDPSTWQDVDSIIGRYGLHGQLPPSASALLAAGLSGHLADTPKPGARVFEHAHTVLLGSNRLAGLAALRQASDFGFRVVYLGSDIRGDAEMTARWYFDQVLKHIKESGRSSDGLTEQPKTICLVGGGETTVLVRGTGKGGRNQQLALRFLALLGELAKTEPEKAERVAFLSAGTDGNDGPTDAAGAYADMAVYRAAGAAGFSIEETLANNDAYHFFAPLGALLITGPTNTNVCDLQIVLVQT